MGEPAIDEKRQDFSLADIRNAIGMFKIEGGMTPPVMDVEITRLGEQTLRGRKKYEVSRMSYNHLIHWMGVGSTISQHMGLPLVFHYTRSDNKFTEAEIAASDFNLEENPEPGYILMRNDVRDPTSWAVIPERDNDSGACAVKRADGRVINPQQVGAIAQYCQQRLYPAMVACTNEKERIDLVRTQMCRSGFEKFFEGLKKQKVEAGDVSWASAVSPYMV